MPRVNYSILNSDFASLGDIGAEVVASIDIPASITIPSTSYASSYTYTFPLPNNLKGKSVRFKANHSKDTRYSPITGGAITWIDTARVLPSASYDYAVWFNAYVDRVGDNLRVRVLLFNGSFPRATIQTTPTPGSITIIARVLQSSDK